jgi:hypothetical protein
MPSARIPELVVAARDVLAALSAAGHPACLIGGLVVPRWGQPRATSDVDCSVLAPYGREDGPLDVLLSAFQPRRRDAREFAHTYRVLLLQTVAGVGIDVSLAALPFEEEAIDRATPWEIVPDAQVTTCSAEHLIVYKLVAGRPQDLVDVSGIVRRQAGGLDVDLVRRWGRQFAALKEEPDLLEPFERALRGST